VSDPKIGRLTLAKQERRQPPNATLHVEYRCSYSTSAGPTVYGIEPAWVEQPGAEAYNPYRFCQGLPDEVDHSRSGDFERLRSATKRAWVAHSTPNSPAYPFDIALVHDFAVGVLRSIEPRAVQCSAAPSPAATRTASPSPTRASTASPSPTRSAPATPGRPLCPEAVRSFGADKLQAAGLSDPSRTGIRVDGDALLDGLQAAIRSHNARYPDDKAYATDGTPLVGTVGALSWLFAEGGAVAGAPAEQYVTGDEKKLYDAIVRLSRVRQAEGGSPLLAPGDILELSLGLAAGDVNKAVLTAHNTLRAQARNDATVQEVTGLTRVPGFFDDHLAKLRDAPDNAGPWYHLFGTAYLELSARGDAGPWLAGAAGALAISSGIVTGGASIVALGTLEALYLYLEKVPGDSGTTRGSEIANAVEQWYRENQATTPRPPDPEKFCFNVWGAQAGGKLYGSLPYKSTRVLRDLRSSFSAPSRATSVERSTGELPDPRVLNLLGSPFSVEWKDGPLTMVLDQGATPGDVRLVGGVPLLLRPFSERDSWGVAWLAPAGRRQTVTFEATKAGAVLHYVRLDTATGDAAVYQAVAAQPRERFTLALDAATLAPPMTRGDGTTVKAEIHRLDLTARSGQPAAAAAGAAIAALVLGGGLLLVRRRRRAALPPPAVPSADSPAAPRARFCARCGAPRSPNAKFCGSCGGRHDTG